MDRRMLQNHSSSPQYLDKFLFNGLIEGGIDRKESTQACHFSAEHPHQSKAVLDLESLQPQLVPYVHRMWHTDMACESYQVKAQRICLKIPPIRSVVLLFILATFQQNVL